jgi:hypothetical protein
MMVEVTSGLPYVSIDIHLTVLIDIPLTAAVTQRVVFGQHAAKMK